MDWNKQNWSQYENVEHLLCDNSLVYLMTSKILFERFFFLFVKFFFNKDEYSHNG